MTDTKLFSLGEDPDAFYSRSACSSTVDGLNWASSPNPFSNLGFVRTVAGSLSSGFVAVSTQNEYAVASDPSQSWTANLLNRNWCVNKLAYTNSQFTGVGFVKNATILSENALILRFQHNSWSPVFTSNAPGSILVNLSPGPLSQSKPSWIAVGGRDKFLKPMMVISNNSGVQWNEISLGDSLPGPISSICFDTSTQPARVWAGGTGWIASASWAGGASVWSLNDSVQANLARRPISSIQLVSLKNQTYRLALSGSTIFVGQGQNEWVPFDFPGVNFSDVKVFKDKLYFSTWGLLRNTTGYKGSFDSQGSLALEPFGNSVLGHVLLTV